MILTIITITTNTRCRYRCSGCNQKVDAKRFSEFRTLPPILTLGLQRLAYDFVMVREPPHQNNRSIDCGWFRGGDAPSNPGCHHFVTTEPAGRLSRPAAQSLRGPINYWGDGRALLPPPCPCPPAKSHGT